MVPGIDLDTLYSQLENNDVKTLERKSIKYELQ